MKTIEINLYKFRELGEDAKQKALEKLYDINVSFDWWDGMYEDAKRIGLRITGFELDRRRGADGEFTLSACEVAQNILNEHGETCETFQTATDFLHDWQPVFNNYIDETHESFESYEAEQTMLEMEDEFLKSLLEDYSIMLQNESEYLMSEEAVVETIESNDYDFTVNGEIH